MMDNPWAAWLRDQEGAQVLPGAPAGTGPAAPAGTDEGGDGRGEEFRGGPFGWDLPPEPRHPRRHLLIAAAALWVLILMVALAAVARPSTPIPSPAPIASPAPAAPVPAASAAVAASPAPAAPVPAALDAGAAVEFDELPVTAPPGGAVGEAGALLVRAALSAPSGRGELARYVDASVVTDIESAGEAQIVSVLALVLTGDGEGWEAAAVERYAVAVSRDAAGSYHPVAGPWALAPPTVPAAPSGTPDADPDRLALATQALHDAGYRDITDLSLLRDPAHPGVLTVQAKATAPEATSPQPWTLWLRDTTTPTVLGTD